MGSYVTARAVEGVVEGVMEGVMEGMGGRNLR